MHRAFALFAIVSVFVCGCTNAPQPQSAGQPPDKPVATTTDKPATPEIPTKPAPPPHHPSPDPKPAVDVHPGNDPRAHMAHEHRTVGSGKPASGGMEGSNTVSGSESDDAAAWHKSLPKGKINHPVLETMELGKPYPINITLSGADAVAQPAQAGTVTDTLQVSPHMIVELTQPDNPDGFKIDPAETQPAKLIASDGNTTWNWSVTPQHLGNLKLHVAAYVLYEDDPNNKLAYDTFDAPVSVHSVTVKHESKSAWEWVQEHPAQTLAYLLPGGAGAAMLGKLIDLWRKRRKKAPKSAKTDTDEDA